jgi:hypothetical protein
MSFLNGSGKRIDTIFPDTYEYFESLAALVEREPADAISPSDLFLLASIGIEKGKAFTPDERTRQLPRSSGPCRRCHPDSRPAAGCVGRNLTGPITPAADGCLR